MSKQRALEIARSTDAFHAHKYGDEDPRTIFTALQLNAIQIAQDLGVSRKEFLRVARDMYDEHNRHDPFVIREISCKRGHRWRGRVYAQPPYLREKCKQCHRVATSYGRRP